MRELAARALAEPEWFYPFVQDFLGAGWLRPWTRLVDRSVGEPFARWFVDGGTNLAWLACQRWVGVATGPAIVWEGDDGATREVTYPELDRQVAAAGAGLRRLGVGRGDVVTMHLPVVPEAIVTMLAAARIGAIVAPAFSGYGPEPLAERIRLGGAKVLITADATVRRGKRVELLRTALAAVERVPQPPRVVVVGRLGDPLPAGVVAWEDLLGGDRDVEIEVLDADTPWLLAFTSGSTGRPKGAVHTHGGMGYSLMMDLGLTLDVGPGDRVMWPADMGWLAGPMTGLGPLTLGATTVLFDGVMDFPRPDRIWSLIERHRVTQYGLAPTVARSLMAFGDRWVDGYGLESLRVIGSSGEPWTAPAWRWLHRTVGRGRVPIVNWSGGTEIGGPIVVCFPNEEAPECGFWGPQLGIDADVVDGAGAPLVGRPGELVIRRGWPNMTRGLWREPERYLESYWQRFPGLWVHGDLAVRHEDGTFEIPGRSDDVMKLAGKRVGPSELEVLVAEVPGVTHTAVIGVPHPTKGEVAVVVVCSTRDDDPTLAEEIAERIEREFGKPLRPAAVLIVDELPLTRSGKVHRRVLRGWVTGRDPGDMSTVDNPEAEAAIADAAGALRSTLDS